MERVRMDKKLPYFQLTDNISFGTIRKGNSQNLGGRNDKVDPFPPLEISVSILLYLLSDF